MDRARRNDECGIMNDELTENPKATPSSSF
jgi:hypothetical protein